MNIVHNIHDLLDIHHIQYNLNDIRYLEEHYSFFVDNYTNKDIKIIHHGHGKICQGPIYSLKILFHITEDKYGTIYSLHKISKDNKSDQQIEYIIIIIPEKIYGNHIDIIKIGGKNNYIRNVNHLSNTLEELYCGCSSCGIEQNGISELKKLKIIE